MNNSAIIQKLKQLGYSTIPEAFYSSVDMWKSCSQGDVKNLQLPH